MLKLIIKKLRLNLSFPSSAERGRAAAVDENYNAEEWDETEDIPADVSEGHFVVHAVKGEETKRFIVQIRFLDDPAFLKLLQMAEEEFGFRQTGALAVPCLPQELQMILQTHQRSRNVIVAS